ncbi:splicing regulator RBM11-like isoform X3 [Oryza brachyantha]|uniref:splicing regulator RBM11-like isoform X3 n=1 Tax=Oryza brachyantha TaxID=4533 RepID=UPI0003EA95CB|nr:splicing regulator RBM11-like isoform X3 [Oryza brachyantha]
MARNPARTVYIGNLDEKVTERVLYEVLVQAGRVVDLYIPCDRETSCPKGYAFAEYETEEIAQYAVRLFSGLVRLYGKPLKFAISGQDKPTSNGKETSNPVMPKLNPVPLPKKHQFVHHSDMPTLHKPAYPMVNGGIIDYCFSNSYPYSHPQAVSVGPVHSNGGFSNAFLCTAFLCKNIGSCCSSCSCRLCKKLF